MKWEQLYPLFDLQVEHGSLFFYPHGLQNVWDIFFTTDLSCEYLQNRTRESLCKFSTVWISSERSCICGIKIGRTYLEKERRYEGVNKLSEATMVGI